jgi:hypothetical protein
MLQQSKQHYVTATLDTNQRASKDPEIVSAAK